MAVIDLHCHLLPGVDDGPATLDGSIALARAASDAGTRTVVATPHLDHHWGVAPERITPAVDAVRQALAEEGIPLEIRAGAEVALPRFTELSPEEVGMVRLGDGPYLLIESPHTPAAGDFHTFVTLIASRGQPVLLAHPERCPTLLRRPDRVAAMVSEGVLCSLTASSLSGAFGEPVRELSLQLLREGLVHNVASDSHDAERRGPTLLEGLAAAEDGLPGVMDQADWLTREVPEAILAGEEIPPRPRLRRRRRGLPFGAATRRR